MRDAHDRRVTEDPEERFARRVTMLFVSLIAAVCAIVVLAYIYDWSRGMGA